MQTHIIILLGKDLNQYLVTKKNAGGLDVCSGFFELHVHTKIKPFQHFKPELLPKGT